MAGCLLKRKMRPNKAALPFDGRPINNRCAGTPPPPPLVLSTLEQLAATMATVKACGTAVVFTKLDVSNMFYTCKLLHHCQDYFRIHINGRCYGFTGLPLG